MAAITKVLNFMNTAFETNTVTNYETRAIDSNIENIYPVVNIDFVESEIDSAIILLYFKVTILQQRDTRNVSHQNKIIGSDNLIDNLNETHYIASRFFAVIENNENTDNIELVEKSKLKILKQFNRNNLDGVQFDCTMSIPNDAYSC